MLVLDDPGRWVPVTFSLPAAAASRRFTRVDVLVKRVLRRGNLGVQVGETIVRLAAGRTP
jgi:hypothetical protein